MDAGEAEYPGDWANTEVEDCGFPEAPSVPMTTLPRGDTSGDAPTGTKRAEGWK